MTKADDELIELLKSDKPLIKRSTGPTALSLHGYVILKALKNNESKLRSQIWIQQDGRTNLKSADFEATLAEFIKRGLVKETTDEYLKITSDGQALIGLWSKSSAS